MSQIYLSDTAQLVKTVQERLTSSARILIAVDGRGGAGKSTLAHRLAESFDGAVVVEFDWFHLPQANLKSDDRFDIERFLNEIVIPFKVGARELTFHKYNWGYLRDVEDSVERNPERVSLSEVLIVEGCHAMHQRLFRNYDLRIWVNTDLDECLRRGKQRDIEEYKLDPSKVAILWDQWSAWQEDMLLKEKLPQRADIIFDSGVDNH